MLISRSDSRIIPSPLSLSSLTSYIELVPSMIAIELRFSLHQTFLLWLNLLIFNHRRTAVDENEFVVVRLFYYAIIIWQLHNHFTSSPSNVREEDVLLVISLYHTCCQIFSFLRKTKAGYYWRRISWHFKRTNISPYWPERTVTS